MSSGKLAPLFRRARTAPRLPVSPPAQPPNDEAHRIWTFNPELAGASQWVTGPTGTVTTPVQHQATPGYYDFATTDIIDFGDSLDTTWTGGGFTIYTCFEVQAGDNDSTDRYILFKGNSGASRQFSIKYNNGTGLFSRVFYNNSSGQWDQALAFLPAAFLGKNIAALVYDPTGVRSSTRVRLYTSATQYPILSQTGADGTVTDTTAHLMLGADAGASNKSLSRIGAVYAYSTAHTATQAIENIDWIRTQRKWF